MSEWEQFTDENKITVITVNLTTGAQFVQLFEVAKLLYVLYSNLK